MVLSVLQAQLLLPLYRFSADGEVSQSFIAFRSAHMRNYEGMLSNFSLTFQGVLLGDCKNVFLFSGSTVRNPALSHVPHLGRAALRYSSGRKLGKGELQAAQT